MGEVILLTDKLVVSAAVQPSPERPTDPNLSTKIWRRSELSDMTIDDIDSYPPSKRYFEQPWPESMTVTLTYPGRPQLRLPLDGQSGSDGALTLARAYPGLIADLTGPEAR